MTDTNQITKEINTLMIPRAALIAYSITDENQYFLELRAIDEKGKMGEARPVTFEFMNEIASNYAEVHNGIPYGKIPGNLLFCDTRKGSEKYIWYNPPQRRMMYFAPNLNIENAMYNIPGVIYEVRENELNIYAYCGKYPTESTNLFAAPFFNVTNTAVCQGIVNLEKPTNPTYTELLEYWEKKFWLTEFTHLGTGSNPTKSNLVLVTKAAQNADFNLKELKSLKITLKDILK